MSLQSIVYCHLRLANNISFQDYKLFAEWLGCYNYILPAQRITIPKLIPAIAIYLNSNISTLFDKTFAIDTNFNSLIQKEILQWILDSEVYHTHRF